MGLNVHRIGRVETSLLIDRLGQGCLGIGIRKLDPLRPSILVDARVNYDSLDGVVVLDRLVQSLEDDSGSPLAAAIAVTPVVKDVALTVGIHHAVHSGQTSP